LDGRSRRDSTFVAEQACGEALVNIEKQQSASPR
jgi:hypothetical protein